MNTPFKWQQVWVKSIQSLPVNQLVEALIHVVVDSVRTSNNNDVINNMWKEEYLVQLINTSMLTGNVYKTDMEAVREETNDKIKSLKANLEEMTSREKKQRERNKALERQIENMRSPELKNLKNLENP